MSVTDELIKANERYAATFDKGDLPTPPAKRLAIVSCMDSRILPSRALGLEEGDAHIIRNAGGLARDALRSLVISQQLLGTNEVIVLHHTECGLLGIKNEDVYSKVRESLGADASGIDFLPFSDLDQSVRDDVQFLKDSPLIADDVTVRGFVYDVHTGTLREVS
ncbi:MAG: beta-class carbonic anhydrase [Thermoleophilaceae bacterium]